MIYIIYFNFTTIKHEEKSQNLIKISLVFLDLLKYILCLCRGCYMLCDTLKPVKPELAIESNLCLVQLIKKTLKLKTLFIQTNQKNKHVIKDSYNL